MTTFTYAQLEEIWIEGGGSKAMAPLMAAIALAESSGNPDNNNYNDSNGQGGTQTSWGLWQISNGTHNMPVPNIDDPVVNAQQAVAKLNSQGLSAWGTYTSGAYQQYLQGNVPPSTSLLDATGGSGGTGGATPAQTTSSNTPLQWTESAIPGFGWFGGLITGATGGLTGINSISDIATGVAGLVRSMNKGLQLALLLFRPSFWLRIGAFWVGTLALIGSAYFFGKTL